VLVINVTLAKKLIQLDLVVTYAYLASSLKMVADASDAQLVK